MTIWNLTRLVVAFSAVVFPLFVGYQTLEQSEQFHEAQQSSDKVARTAQVMASFYSSHAIQKLSHFADQVEIEANRRRHDHEGHASSKEFDVFSDLSKDDSDAVRASIMHFIRTLDTIYYCGWSDSVREEVSCDKQLLFGIYFEEISWMFSKVRAGIYCDHAIQHLFDYEGDVNKDSAIYRLETMLLDYLKSDLHLARHSGISREDIVRLEADKGQSKVGHGLRPNLETFCRRADRESNPT